MRAAYSQNWEALEDATGLSRGGSRLPLAQFFREIANSVRLHRARRWHHQKYLGRLVATNMTPPPDKPGGISRTFPRSDHESGSEH